jgi:UDP-glucose 4-epimerase
MNKKILITGSQGYIGSHLIQMISDRYDIYKLDLRDPTNPLDIRSDFSFDIEFDAVIHLAALVNVSKSTKYPEEYFNTNVNGTINVLKKLKYKNFVFASTGSAAGMLSPYGISKRMAELVVEDFCKINQKDFTMFRFYNVTGSDNLPPTNPDGLFFSLMRAEKEGIFYLYGDDYNTKDGSCIRDYTHVNEICNALSTAIETPANGLENLGHGIGTSVKEMVEIYKRVNNCDFEVKVMPRRPGDLEVSVLENVSIYMTKKYTMNDLMRKYDGTLLSEL